MIAGHGLTCCGALLAEGADPTAGMSEREKKLWQLQRRLAQSRKANQARPLPPVSHSIWLGLQQSIAAPCPCLHRTIRHGAGAADGWCLVPVQDAVVAEKRRHARPAGADEAADKKRWLEEKKKRQEDDLQRMGLEEKQVRAGNLKNPEMKRVHRQPPSSGASCAASRHATSTGEALHLLAPPSTAPPMLQSRGSAGIDHRAAQCLMTGPKDSKP